jgi:hypothetical protein
MVVRAAVYPAAAVYPTTAAAVYPTTAAAVYPMVGA